MASTIYSPSTLAFRNLPGIVPPGEIQQIHIVSANLQKKNKPKNPPNFPQSPGRKSLWVCFAWCIDFFACCCCCSFQFLLFFDSADFEDGKVATVFGHILYRILPPFGATLRLNYAVWLAACSALVVWTRLQTLRLSFMMCEWIFCSRWEYTYIRSFWNWLSFSIKFIQLPTYLTCWSNHKKRHHVNFNPLHVTWYCFTLPHKPTRKIPFDGNCWQSVSPRSERALSPLTMQQGLRPALHRDRLQTCNPSFAIPLSQNNRCTCCSGLPERLCENFWKIFQQVS